MSTVYGYWTCDYCNKENCGDKRQCEHCGKTRGKTVEFYLTPRQINEPRKSAPKSRGPDWLCSYCDSLNPAGQAICGNCGHPRDKQDKDYFQLHPEEAGFRPLGHDFGIEEAPREEVNVDFGRERVDYTPKTPTSNTDYSDDDARRRLPSIWPKIAIVLGAIMFVLLLIKVFIPTTTEATILDKNWERQVKVEEYRTFHESGWSIPSGGRQTRSYQAIHHYTQVLDHYETVTKYRQVPDGGHYEVTGQRKVVSGGYERVVGYTNNGDGTFDEVKEWVPTYSTEDVMTWVTDYKTEAYAEKEPVYRDEPVYQTKYEYDIERWTFDHYETTSGHLDEPYFAEPELTSKYRINGTRENYSVSVSCLNRKGGTIITDCTLGYAEWSSLEVGQIVPAKLYLDSVVTLKLTE